MAHPRDTGRRCHGSRTPFAAAHRHHPGRCHVLVVTGRRHIRTARFGQVQRSAEEPAALQPFRASQARLHPCCPPHTPPRPHLSAGGTCPSHERPPLRREIHAFVPLAGSGGASRCRSRAVNRFENRHERGFLAEKRRIARYPYPQPPKRDTSFLRFEEASLFACIACSAETTVRPARSTVRSLLKRPRQRPSARRLPPAPLRRRPFSCSSQPSAFL